MKRTLFVVLLMIAGYARATTYYVNNSGGSDSNACTVIGSPCATIAGAIGKAGGPGDTIQIAASGTNYAWPASFTKSGTAGNLFTIQGQTGSGCPTTASSNPYGTFTTHANPGVHLSGSGATITANYLVFDCLDFGNQGFGWDTAGGVYHHAEVKNVIAVNFWTSGITAITATNYAHDLNLHNNYTTGGNNAYFMMCSACTIKDNEAYALNLLSTGSDHDYMDFWGNGSTIEHNYFHGNTCNACNGYDCHMDNIQSFNTTGNGREVMKNNTITRNVFFNAHENIILQDNAGNGDISNNTITNNVLAFAPIDDGSGHMCVAGAVHPWCAIVEDGAQGTNYFMNNTCVSGTTGFRSMTGTTNLSDNLYVGSAGTIVDFSSATVTGSKNMSQSSGSWGLTSPSTSQAVNIVSAGTQAGYCAGCDYSIQTTSAAKNAGISTSPTVVVDLNGVSRPASPSTNYAIGAYEFVSGSPIAPTVTSTSASSVTTSTASAGGNVTSDGGATVTSRGTCYSTSVNPTTPCTSDGTGTGSFSSSLMGLASSTGYHIRAFATNGVGTSYGSDLTFTTSSGAATITGSNTISQANPQLAGSQIGAQTQYDSGQIYKNLLFNGHNAGNEPFIQTQMYQIQSGGTLNTTHVQSNINNTQYDGVAANFWVGSTITFYILGAAPGSDVFCTSTITANTITGTGPNGPVFTFSPACPSAPVAAVHIFRISKTQTNSPGEWFCSGGGGCNYQQADVCFPDCGVQTLEVNALSGTVNGGLVNDQTAQDQFFLINGGTWTNSFRGKVKSGTPAPVTFTVKRGVTTLCSFSTTLTTSWAAISSSACVNPVDTGTGAPQQLTYAMTVNSGQDVLLDNFDFEKTSGNDVANTSIFRDEFVHAHQSYNRKGITTTALMPPCRYGPEFINDMSDMIQDSQFTHKIDAPGFNYGPLGNSQGVVPIGLKQFFDYAFVVGCRPYVILPLTATAADVTAFVHWLSTSGNAARFPSIHAELGNEEWNGIFVGYSLGFNNSSPSYYYDYMKRSGTLITAMRAQATTDSITNLEYMVGIQTTGIPITSTELGYAKADRVLINGYMMNTTFTDSTSPVKWNTTLTKPKSMTANAADPTSYLNLKNSIVGSSTCGASGSTACKVGVYEENLHAYIGSLTQASVDGYVDGRGMTEVMTDLLLSSQEIGSTFHNVFASVQYLLGSGGLNIHLFADAVEYGGADSLFNGVESIPRPQFLAGYLHNRFLIGPMYQGTVTSPDSCALAATANDVPAQALTCERVFFSNDGAGHHTMMVLNRDQFNTRAVTYSGSFVPPVGLTVTKTVITGSGIQDKNEADNLNATNAWPLTVNTSSSNVIMPSGETLGAASVILYEWTSGASGPMSSVYMQKSANGIDDGYPISLLPGAEWDDYAQPIYENNPLSTWSNPAGTVVTFTLLSGSSTIQVGDMIFVRNFSTQPDTLCQVAASPAPTSSSFTLDVQSCNGTTSWTSAGSGSALGAYYWKKEGTGMNPNVTWSIITTGATPVKAMLRNIDKTVNAVGSPCANPDLHTSTCYVVDPVLTNVSPIQVWLELDPSATPTCSMTGTMQAGTLALTSTHMFKLRATTIQDPSKFVDRDYIMCQPGAGSGKLAVMHMQGGYEQSFKNEKHPIYTQTFANADQYTIWSIASDSGTGNATLTTFPAPVGDAFVKNGGTLPEVIFNSGTSTDGYTITACADADPTACAVTRRWVSAQTKPTLNPDLVVQAPCDTDPVMTAAGGVVYDIGPGQTYADFTAIPTWNYLWGSIFKFHGESGTGGSPVTLANYMEFKFPTNFASFTNNQTVPSFYLCGIPSSTTGDLPILEANHATANSNIGGFTGLGNVVTLNGISATIPVPDKYTGTSNQWHQWGMAGIRIQHNTPGYTYFPPGMTTGPEDPWGLGSAIRPFSTTNFTVKGIRSILNANGMLSDCNSQAGWIRNCSSNGRMYGSHGEGYGVNPNPTEHFIYLQDFHDVADYNLEDGSNSEAATGAFSMRGFRSLYIGNRVYCKAPYHCPNGWGGNSENQDSAYYLDIPRQFGPTPTWAGGTTCGDGSAEYPFCSDPAHPGMAFGGLPTEAAFNTEHFHSFYMMGNALKSLNTSSGDGCNVSISQNHGGNGLEMQHKIYYGYNLVDCPRAEAYGGAYQFEDVRPTSGVFGPDVQPVAWPTGHWFNNIDWWVDNTGGGGFYSPFGRPTGHVIFKTNMGHIGQFSPLNVNIPLTPGAYGFNQSQSGISQQTTVDEFVGMYPVEAKFGATWTTANFLTSPVKPYDITTLKPISGSALIGAATTTLPYPASLYPPMFNAIDAGAVMSPRVYLNTIGPYDQVVAPGTAGFTFTGGTRFSSGNTVQ